MGSLIRTQVTCSLYRTLAHADIMERFGFVKEDQVLNGNNNLSDSNAEIDEKMKFRNWNWLAMRL